MASSFSLTDLPDAIQDLIVAHLASPHALLRRRPEMLRDAAALCLTARGTTRMGALLRETAVREEAPEKWLSLHEVSKSFLLKPSDRSDIPQKVEFEGSGRRRWPVPYWSRASVVRRCLEKYGGEAGFDAEKARLDRARVKRLEAERKRRAARRQTLEAALRKVGCSLRGDSRLCNEFIASGAGDPDAIALTMCEMQFFHTCTSYPQVFDAIRRDALRWEGYYDRDDVSEAAKEEALGLWARQFETPEVAAARPELPGSLRPKVLRM